MDFYNNTTSFLDENENIINCQLILKNKFPLITHWIVLFKTKSYVLTIEYSTPGVEINISNEEFFGWIKLNFIFFLLVNRKLLKFGNWINTNKNERFN